jgi:hypothetical protein
LSLLRWQTWQGGGICQLIEIMRQILAKRKARLTPCLFQSLFLMPVFALPKPGFGNLLEKR